MRSRQAAGGGPWPICCPVAGEARPRCFGGRRRGTTRRARASCGAGSCRGRVLGNGRDHRPRDLLGRGRGISRPGRRRTSSRSDRAPHVRHAKPRCDGGSARLTPCTSGWPSERACRCARSTASSSGGQAARARSSRHSCIALVGRPGPRAGPVVRVVTELAVATSRRLPAPGDGDSAAASEGAGFRQSPRTRVPASRDRGRSVSSSRRPGKEDAAALPRRRQGSTLCAARRRRTRASRGRRSAHDRPVTSTTCTGVRIARASQALLDAERAER